MLLRGFTILLALGMSPAWAADAPKGDAAKGRALYMTNGCSYCHGTAGQGGGGRTGGLRIANQGNRLRGLSQPAPPSGQRDAALCAKRDAR